MSSVFRGLGANALLLSRYRSTRDRYRAEALQLEGVSNMIPRTALPNTETLFVLGSGTSINYVTPQRWREINSHASIGLNHFLVHDFTPNILTVEGMQSRRVHTAYLNNVSVKASKAGRQYVLLATGIEAKEGLSLSKLRESVPSIPIYLLPTVRCSLRNLDALKATVAIYKASGLFNVQQEVRRLWGPFSLIRAVYLGIAFGFSRIVLCGIDLTGPYFFEQPSDLYSAKGYEIDPLRSLSPTIHDTANRRKWPVNVIDIIMLIRNTLCTTLGISLYAATDESALHPYLPSYWD